MIHEIHLKAPGNWINDPNGFIFYKGQYHLFYQYFPYGTRWGTMHWGHAISENMITWKHIGIALFPSKEYDKNGVFSGSAIEKDGKLQLYYTSIVYEECNPDDVHISKDGRLLSSQSMIVSDDGIHFDNWNNKRQIIPVCYDETIGDSSDMRDPKVWFDGEKYTLILGSTFKSKEGRIVFYRSEDSINWSYQNMVQDSRLGIILECPDLFKLKDVYFLVGSPIAILDLEGVDKNQATIRKVNYDTDNSKLILTDDFQFIDYGFELYAPQSNLDAEGRRVMIGWMRMPGPVDAEIPWIGMMTIPRVVSYKNGHVYFNPHPNISQAFKKKTDSIDFKNDNKYRIISKLKSGESISVGGYVIKYSGEYVMTDRSIVMGKYDKVAMHFKSPKLICNECYLEIFAEPNLIEVFINDGEYVISNVVYDLKDEIDGNYETIEQY